MSKFILIIEVCLCFEINVLIEILFITDSLFFTEQVYEVDYDNHDSHFFDTIKIIHSSVESVVYTMKDRSKVRALMPV